MNAQARRDHLLANSNQSSLVWLAPAARRASRKARGTLSLAHRVRWRLVGPVWREDATSCRPSRLTSELPCSPWRIRMLGSCSHHQIFHAPPCTRVCLSVVCSSRSVLPLATLPAALAVAALHRRATSSTARRVRAPLARRSGVMCHRASLLLPLPLRRHATARLINP